MEPTDWTKRLRELYDKALGLYRNRNRDADLFFDAEELAFLASIGLKPINVYDFVEDFLGSGEPDWDSFLLCASARRDYFLQIQHGQPAPDQPFELPGRNDMLGDIPWLPRIAYKAQCFLEGRLRSDIMYCCGGDRGFLRRHHLHPADFLRAIWAARGDEQKILAFVTGA